MDFKIKEKESRQAIVFEAPADLVPKRTRLDVKNNENYADAMHAWISSVCGDIEELMERIVNDDFEAEDLVEDEITKNKHHIGES